MNLRELLENAGFVKIAGGDLSEAGKVENVIVVYARRDAPAPDYAHMTNAEALNSDPDAVMALQKYLTIKQYYSWAVDGVVDEPYSATVYALQRYLADRNVYWGRYDGKLDPEYSSTVRGLQSVVGATASGHVDAETLERVKELR